MQVHRTTTSFVNNYSTKSTQNQKQNPAFGKLILDKTLSTKQVEAVLKNNELKKLVQKFDSIGKDIYIEYPHSYQGSIYISQRGVCYDIPKGVLMHLYPFSKIYNLEEGLADELFNKYLKKEAEKAEKAKELEHRANLIDSYNKSIEQQSPKRSFLQRLFGSW